MQKIRALKKENDFLGVFRFGSIIRERFFILRYRINNFSYNRFAYSISKKNVSKAVVRNKIKRRFKEMVRKQIGAIRKGIDGVFIIKGGSEKVSFRLLEEKIKTAFNTIANNKT